MLATARQQARLSIVGSRSLDLYSDQSGQAHPRFARLGLHLTVGVLMTYSM